MSLDATHFVGTSLLESDVPHVYHLRVHSSGIEVTYPAGIHMDDANATTDQIVKLLGDLGSGVTVESGFDRINGSGFKVSDSRSIRRPKTVHRLDQHTVSGMLRFPDRSVCFVTLETFAPHACGPFVQRSGDRIWRCDRCHRRALKRDLKTAGVTT